MALKYQPWLCTLDYVRQHRQMDFTTTGDNELLKATIEEASGELIAALGRIPLPYVETLTLREKYLRDSHLWREAGEYLLTTPQDVLAITTLTWIGTVLTAVTQYRLGDENSQPNREIAIDVNALSDIFPNTFSESVDIAAIWGYVPHYDTTAWKDSGQNVPTGTMTSDATVTTMTPDDNSAIEVGDYLRMETEVVFVTANISNTVTMERGALGTTAAVHAITVDIEQFQQLPDIRGAAREIAVYKYLSKDRVGGRVTVFDGGSVIVEDIDPSVQRTIKRHRRVKFASV